MPFEGVILLVSAFCRLSSIVSSFAFLRLAVAVAGCTGFKMCYASLWWWNKADAVRPFCVTIYLPHPYFLKKPYIYNYPLKISEKNFSGWGWETTRGSGFPRNIIY